MRNLKRVLTMIMAIAMTMSLMVVGAGAAFPDQDKVVNTDAVNMNVALNIIQGRDNGAFDPTGNVTRGEMAKMITIALNGGKDIPTGTQIAPTFSDIKGHWAEGYIEYCNTFGIVAGMGDGTFAPDASVTATQAAKMLLVAMGYDPKHENFNGLNWTITINGRASQKNLYKGLAVDIQAPLNRDNAAQMIWNALQAKQVEYVYSPVGVDGKLDTLQVLREKATSLLSDKFDANDTYSRVMVGYRYDSKKKEYTYELAASFATHISTPAATDTFKSKTDYTALFGLNTKVVHKNNTAKDVFGMFANESNVMYTGIVGDIEASDATNLKVDGVKMKTDGFAGTDLTATPVFYERTPGAGTTLDAHSAAPFYLAKVIDLDADDKIDYVIVTPYSVAEVTYVGTKNINLATNFPAPNVATSLKFDEAEIEDGLKKDDKVILLNSQYNAAGEISVAKLDEVAGTVKARRTNEVQLDGTWYDLVNGLVGNNFNLNDKYTLYTVGSYVFFKSEGDNKTLADVALISKAEFAGLSKQAIMHFADGTSDTVTLDDVTAAGSATTDIEGAMVTYSKDGNKYDITVLSATNQLGYKYESATKAAGNYLEAATSNRAARIVIAAGSTAGTYAIADEAVVFVQYGEASAGVPSAMRDKKVKVMTGAAAKAYKANWVLDATATSTGTNGINLLHKSVNGVATAFAANFVIANANLGSTVGTTDNYGILLSNPADVQDADKNNYKEYKIWNGKEEITVLQKGFVAGETATLLVKGAIISYDNVGDNKIDNVDILKDNAGTNAAGYYAVLGNENDKILSLVAAVNDGTGYGMTGAKGLAYAPIVEAVITKDTVVMFVDGNAGTTSGAYQTATPVGLGADETLVTNVFVYDKQATNAPGEANEVELIIVEVNNEWSYTFTA